MLIGTAIKVDINPVIAGAIPAICPTGCIAIASPAKYMETLQLVGIGYEKHVVSYLGTP